MLGEGALLNFELSFHNLNFGTSKSAIYKLVQYLLSKYIFSSVACYIFILVAKPLLIPFSLNLEILTKPNKKAKYIYNIVDWNRLSSLAQHKNWRKNKINIPNSNKQYKCYGLIPKTFTN